MSNGSSAIVQKLWNYCNLLRDDGLSYGDYVEQLTFLLFLKMADEQMKPPYNRARLISKDLDWVSLERLDGDALESHYRHVLTELGKQPGMLGVIFRKAQNKVQDPAKLKRLITDLIGKEQWMTLEVDVKGDAYEGLLEKNVADVKGGAGQYFTPRALIKAIVDIVRPAPGETVNDPACGTGGFLLAAYDYVSNHYELDKTQKRTLRHKTLSGTELVASVARLCVMNLFLHGIGGEDSPIRDGIDALAQTPSTFYDVVLTNPHLAKNRALPLSAKRERKRRRLLPTIETTSGQRRGTNSLISCST
jgi:type I restriction enzyme M protein